MELSIPKFRKLLYFTRELTKPKVIKTNLLRPILNY